MFQWLFLVPVKGGRWHIIHQLAVCPPFTGTRNNHQVQEHESTMCTEAMPNSNMLNIWVFPKNRGTPKIIHFNRGFYEINPSILGYWILSAASRMQVVHLLKWAFQGSSVAGYLWCIGLLVGMLPRTSVAIGWRFVAKRSTCQWVHDNVAKETKYFHLLNISNMTFDEYTVKMKDWPSLAGYLESLDVSET